MTEQEMRRRLTTIATTADLRDLTQAEVDEYERLDRRVRVHETSRAIRTGYDAGRESVEDDFRSYLRSGVPGSTLTRAQSEGVGSEGGYLVPPGFRAKLVERLLAFGGLASVAETMNTSTGNPMEWPTVDDTANEGEIVSEGGVFFSGADITFGTATLGAYKYFAGGAGNTAVKVSWELLQDSAFDIEGFLARVLGIRIARIQAQHFITGTGVGQPKGLIHGKTGIEIASAGDGVTYADLVTLVHTLDMAYRPGASWLMNDSTLEVLEKMEDDIGRPLWVPEGGLVGSPSRGTLLGFPVTIDQAMPDLDTGDETANAIAFGDFSRGYLVRRVKDITLVALREKYAETGHVAFLAWARADAVPQDSNAYVLLAGSSL